MKKLFVLITMFMVCTFALGAVTSDAQVIYGIKHPPAGSKIAHIYEIDVDGCGLYEMASPELDAAPTASWNGNAYDIVNDRYYFSQFNNTPKTLWMIRNFSTAPELVESGVLSASISNGTFYNGKYYYIGHNTDDLYEVTFNADGTVKEFGEGKLADISGNLRSWYFGDIAIDPRDGVLYGSVSSGATIAFFTWDGNDYEEYVATNAPEALQIAFGGSGVLYGYSIKNNVLYTIDTADGSVTYQCTSSIDFSDLASGPTFEKQIVGGPDVDQDGETDVVVEVGQTSPIQYQFRIIYSMPGPPVLITDTVPAEWQVLSVVPQSGTVVSGQANKKNNKKGATKIYWTLNPAESSWLTVTVESRKRSSRKYAPTSCGALYLNDGAQAFEIDPETGEPLVDELGNRLPPIYESNNLCLGAVEDINGNGIIGDGSGDEDGDGLTDLDEACSYGTSPCLADTDEDGVDDGIDGCPNDPDKTEPGDCGCGVSDTDLDGDLIPDCIDPCPADPDNMCQ